MVELDSRALRIVEACLDLDGAAREDFIDRESGGSAALGARVRQILAMEEEGESLLATRIIELDRGKLSSFPGDFENYLRKKEEMLEIEARA